MSASDWKYDPQTWKVVRREIFYGNCPCCESPYVGEAYTVTTPTATVEMCCCCWELLLADSEELKQVPIEEGVSNG